MFVQELFDSLREYFTARIRCELEEYSEMSDEKKDEIVSKIIELYDQTVADVTEDMLDQLPIGGTE